MQAALPTYKVAQFLVENFDVVLLPSFETFDMVSKSRRKICPKSAQQMQTQSHFAEGTLSTYIWVEQLLTWLAKQYRFLVFRVVKSLIPLMYAQRHERTIQPHFLSLHLVIMVRRRSAPWIHRYSRPMMGVIATIGILITAYLTYVSFVGGAALCPANAETGRSSPESFGIIGLHCHGSVRPISPAGQRRKE
jgi:hypothetical protein